MKPKVNYAILEDMRKYIKDFRDDDYEQGEYTDNSVIRHLRDYYEANLPVDVTAWIRVNEPDENLIYAKGCGRQVVFVRDEINELLRSSYEEWKENEPMVISTHRSKSVKLPVFQFTLEKYGVEIILRDNFYDWKVSINSEKPLELDFMGLFDPTKVIPDVYCEGFPKDKVYGCYAQNHSQFTCEIESNYDLYTFFFLLKNYLGIKKED